MSTPTSKVVHVALGARRMRAARNLAEIAAAGGRRVLLVVADRPEWAAVAWADADRPPAVTVRRVGSADPRDALKAARRLLLGKNGPLTEAGLLIAGDPEAMPIADAARRRHPRLEVRADLTPEPGRRPAAADVAVVTPWYPSPNDPFAGAFVQATTQAVGDEPGRVATLHTENWFYAPKGVTGKLIGVALERELDRQPGVTVVDAAEGELTRVVAPQVSNGTYTLWARSQAERLAAVLPTGRIEAPLVHAHTGHYAGVVAAALIRDDAKLVVTEHATFLDKIFEEVAARREYDRVLQRASRMLCVGQSLYDQVAERFPHHQGKLRVVPNPVDFDRFAVRPQPPEAPLRWLYVGRMLEHKGVHTLLEAFARVAAEDPRVTLTLVGSGALEKQLRNRIAELGLGDRVRQLPPVPPEQVTALMHEHDVLTHASRSETFGMTLVEAIATETPVLAARSKGPGETLRGLDHIAGQLFEVTDEPAEIVAAYRKLAASWDRLDLPAARAKLRARFGREVVGAQLRAIYAEVLAESPVSAVARVVPAPAEPPAPDADRIAVVAMNSSAHRITGRFVAEAREQGYAVDLIALEPELWRQFDGDQGVHLHTIGEAESSRAPRRLEEKLVTSLPRWVLGFLRARARGFASPLPEALAITAQRGHKLIADRFHKKIYGPYYAVVRPRVLWRITRREVLPSLDLARTRRVVVHGVQGVTIGWGLARANPAIAVGTDLSLPPREAPAGEPVS